MKRSILSIVLVLALTLSLFAICVSAEETKTSLIPAEGAAWTKTDHGDASVNVEYTDSAVVFSGSVSGTWPSIQTWYTDAPIVADVEDDYLSIDFKIEGGTTNINFFFEDSANSANSYSFTICNTALGVEEGKYDTGSGDLYDAEYKLNLKMSDLVASTKLLVPQGAEKGEAFPAAAIVDGQVKFIGIQVYSVNGATVTINDFSVVNVSEDADPEPEPEPDPDPVVGNLAAGKTYTTTAIYAPEGTPNYPDENGNSLTDGVISPSEVTYSDPVWVGFHKNSSDYVEDGEGAVVVFDLGETETLTKGIVHTYKQMDVGITVPYKAVFSVSEDGETYTEAGVVELTPDDIAEGVYDIECTFDEAVTGRYVKVNLYMYGWGFVSEIELLGETDAPVVSEPEQSEPESSEPPKTGDAGILVFAVLAVVAIAGAAVAVKARG